MRKLFIEYYDLSEQQIKNVWENSLIVFDTNVLLNLYRYNDDTRNEFLKVIETYNDRLWIPYQVGLEFHKKRTEIIRKHLSTYKDFGKELSEQILKCVDSLIPKYSRHPYIDLNDIRRKIERSTESIKKSLIKQSTLHPNFLESDPILDSITRLFDGRTGSDFSEEKLEELYNEGEKRFSNKIPPGYCDEKKTKGQDKRTIYGDLIVWKQTIQYCKDQKRHLIFVTDDHKQDWWEQIEGKHIPRKELIKEFVSSTGCDILIYDSKRFLEYAKANNDYKVSNKTIKEIGQLQRTSSSRSKLLREYLAEHNANLDSLKLLNLDFAYTKPHDLFGDYIRNLKNITDVIDNYKKLQETIKLYKQYQYSQRRDDSVEPLDDEE